MSTDEKLIKKYSEIYKAGEEDFWTFLPVDERRSVLGSLQHWTGFDVLEIGCGTGDMAAQVATAGAQSVTAIDAAVSAIDRAQAKYQIENLHFFHGDYREFHKVQTGEYDVVIMVGVLEHFKKPFKELMFIMQHIVKKGGIALITCPNFINPRGYIWMTLQILFGYPMSLTDKHQILPGQMEKFCNDCGYGLSVTSLDIDWAMGPRALIDFKKRLPAAGPDLDPKKIEQLLDWLTNAMPYERPGEYNGANLLYQIARGGEAPTIQ